MRNPFRHNKKTPEYASTLTATMLVSLKGDDTSHPVRITVDYNSPRAAVAGMYKLSSPPYLHNIGLEIGAYAGIAETVDDGDDE
ncbi:hypothetical protein FK529_05630 [Tsukamurella asaccharolytica]|uniref:Uncharacterized protein n=1 Tax=Tsukamurella asaccharolytica TaxID=2592067 RepID=A0A5C5REE0_9ACTN|nr:hypothetical protein [Tsukamurella asaccharolytica]TWS20803.1 hypothetical protein FK529_05630 [Tsukamurella asaccharolytica]